MPAMSNNEPQSSHLDSSDASLNSLPLPALADLEAALAFFRRRRPRKIYLTAVFQMQVNSTTKRDELLAAHQYVTDFTRRVLTVFKQDESQVGDASVQQDDRQKKVRERPRRPLMFKLLVEMLASEDAQKAEHRKRTQADNQQANDRVVKRGELLADFITAYFNANHLTPDDRYFSSKLRTGVYKRCGVTLLNWCSALLSEVASGQNTAIRRKSRRSKDVTQSLGEAESKEALLERMYALLADWDARYKAAQETKLPFGRHKGKTLAEVGRRDLRWLLQRLPGKDVIDTTLEYLEILLELRVPKSEREANEAQLAEHPWRRSPPDGLSPQVKRAVRVRRMDSRTPEIKGDLLLLIELDRVEQERLREELLEQQEYRAAFEQICAAVEFMLSSTSPEFPSIPRMALPDDSLERKDLERDYTAALRWFRAPFPQDTGSKERADYTPEELAELEAVARANLARAAHALESPDFQPVSLKRTMAPIFFDPKKKEWRPGVYDSFAILYDAHTGAYVLALVTRNKRPPLPKLSKQRIKTTGANGTMSIAGLPIGEHLHFLNFPAYRFAPPKRNKIMMFSLEYAREYQENEFLIPLIARLRAANPLAESEQAALIAAQNAAEVEVESDDSADELQVEVKTERDDDEEEQGSTKKDVYRRSRAALGSLDVVCRWDKAGNPRFFAHVPVPFPVPDRATLPERVLGLHEHLYGYSYALLSLAGEVLAAGDLAVNPDVLPRQADSAYNPNYPHEVMAAILKLIERKDCPNIYENVYIGYQDVSVSRTVGISRATNRDRFSRPSQRIHAILEYKAHLHGLLTPRPTSQVSAVRDCSQCGVKLSEGQNAVRRVLYVACPHCRYQQPFREAEDVLQECTNPACGMLWRSHEAWIEREFVCPACHHPPMIARHNTAIVVAQRTLGQIALHHQRILALKQAAKERAD
jgi:hypothetical protein